MVHIINGSDIDPICCETEMELVSDENKLKHIPDDKNICGAVLKCQKCNFKLIALSELTSIPQHHMEEMVITAERTTGEWDQIYECSSCGQIIKITREGCGQLHCCDEAVCVMDVEQVKELKDKIEIELEKIHEKPYEEPYFVCDECDREIKILKIGKGEVICHGKAMIKRPRIGYYFQGGG
jgi:desulfoferrodoxin-like iron-binding protein